MENQPQNPEFWNNPENLHTWKGQTSKVYNESMK